MFQLIPTPDTGFHGVVNDYGHDDSPKTPRKSDFDLEGRLKECLLLLENERSNNRLVKQRFINLENLASENKVMKEEISKLKVKLEEAQCRRCCGRCAQVV